MKTPGTVLTILLTIAACWTARAGAQTPVPLLEPRYTRIVGSDSLRMAWPALSPDGRWLIFTAPAGPGTYKYNLWIVPGAGGVPRRLTTGSHLDLQAQWFPAGDRIAFTTDRTGGHLMTLSINPSTGEPVGVPRQVTLEHAGNFAISPDGREIAYIARPDSGFARELRIVPATGGPERVIHKWPQRMFMDRVRGWSRDGRSLVVVQHDGRRRWLVELPINGDGSDTLYAGRTPIPASLGGEYALLRLDDQTAGSQPTYELNRLGAGSVAQFRLPRGMEAAGFTPDGRGLLAVASDVVTSINVAPVEGGATQHLTEARAYDWVLGWSDDGRSVVIETPLNGTQAVLLAPLDRTAMRQLKPPDAPDPRFPVSVLPGDRLLYAVQPSGAPTFTLKVFNARDGSVRVISRALPIRTIQSAYTNLLAGPGDGRWVDGDGVLYFEERRGRVEIYRLPPAGAPRLVYAFPMDLTPPAVAVAGDRVAFAKPGKQHSEVFVARSGQSPKRILALDAWANVRLWSRDGRRLLVERTYPDGRVDSDMLVVELTASGDSAVATRTFDAGAKWWWDVRWLPGDRGLVYLGMGWEGEDDADVWMLSFEPDGRPVCLTRDDPRQFWGVQLSPDGRYVAYAPEIWRGSSIWRVDLSEVLAAGAQGRP